MGGREYININMGRLTHEQASNIAREMRYLWRYYEKIYPAGDRKAAADMKVTKDRFDQYHFYINHAALRAVMFHLKDIQAILPTGKQATDRSGQLPDCPPEVPDFLRWDGSSSAG